MKYIIIALMFLTSCASGPADIPFVNINIPSKKTIYDYRYSIDTDKKKNAIMSNQYPIFIDGVFTRSKDKIDAHIYVGASMKFGE